MRGAVLAGVAAGLTACALFTPIDDGFSGGGGDDHDSGAPDGGSTTPTTDASSAQDSGGPATDASVDAAPDGPSFHDDFERADSLDLGNGWIEKTPTIFRLASGAVYKGITAVQYHDTLVYRPLSEDYADVEVAATFILGPQPAYPQIFARAQRSSIANALAYDAYIVFVPTATTAVIARQTGPGEETDLATVNLADSLGDGSRVRVTLRVSGKMPVTLEAFIDRVGGPDAGAGTIRIGEAKTTDTTAQRLETSGAVGFTAAYEAVGIDDFEWRALGTP